MLRLLAGLVLSAALTTAAWADITEANYATDAFGTVAVFEVDAPVAVQGEYGYWSDTLPDKLYDGVFLLERVNAVRSAAGQPLLGDDVALYAMPGDSITDERTAYELTFEKLTPAEVKSVLAGVDNLGTLLPGARLSFRPLTQTSMYFSTLALDEALAVGQAGVKLSFNPGTGSRAMLAQLQQAFQRRFGSQTRVDGFYYTESLDSDGNGTRSISFLVDIAPAAHDDTVADDEEFQG